MSDNLTVGRTKIYGIHMSDLDIKEDWDMESKISYILSIDKLDDVFGLSASNMAALLKTNPKYVRQTCEESDKFKKVGQGKGFKSLSMWRLAEKVKEENNE